MDKHDDAIEVHSTFVVYQTDPDGYTKQFCTGKYLDHVISTNTGLKFRKHVAVVDTWAIDTLLATPV